MQISSTAQYTYLTVTSAVELMSAPDYVRCITSATHDVEVTLPADAAGVRVAIRNFGQGNVVLNVADGSEHTIEGIAESRILGPDDRETLQFVTGNWELVG